MATRRQFIRITTMGAGAVMAGAAGMKMLGNERNSWQKTAGAALTGRTPTYCEICFWKAALGGGGVVSTEAASPAPKAVKTPVTAKAKKKPSGGC